MGVIIIGNGILGLTSAYRLFAKRSEGRSFNNRPRGPAWMLLSSRCRHVQLILRGRYRHTEE